MKLEEAITNLECNLKTYPHLEHENFGKAIKLGIEAGKREIECREGAPREDWCLLPGETEE